MQGLPPQPLGSLYQGPSLAPLIRANEQQWLITKQQFGAGGGANVNTTGAGGNPFATMAVQLERFRGNSYPNGVSFMFYFTDVTGNVAVNPGAFEVDVQNSDIDQDIYYCTVQQLTSLNPSQVGRIELTSTYTKFTRLYLKTITTPAYLSALVTR